MPAAIGSFETLAANDGEPPAAIWVGGKSPALHAIVTGCCVMARITLADTAGSVVDVAVKVTVFPIGTYAGAVYNMAMLLPTWTGFKAPQTFVDSRMVLGLPPHSRLQSMPRFGPSLPTGTLTLAVAFTITDETTAPLAGSVTEMEPSFGLAEEHPANERRARHERPKARKQDDATQFGRCLEHLSNAASPARNTAGQSAT
jgi:hypothetical protein